MSPGIYSLLMLIIFLGLIFLNVPIGFALGAAGLAGLLFMDQSLMLFPQTLISGIENFSLLAIPFFVLLGIVMEKSGISRTLVELADELLGFLTGGMAIGTVLASMLFATASGSGPATVAAIGSITIPEMVSKGYSKRFAVGVAASAGALGPIIPPSIPAIIYGVVAEESIAKLFLGCLGAGVLFAFLMMATSFIKAKWEHVPRSQKKPSARKIGRALWNAKIALGAPLLVLGGIYAGIFTPTEAGAIGSIYVILVALFFIRTMSLKGLYECFEKTAKTSAMIMFVIAVAYLFAWLMAAARIPHLATEAIMAFADTQFSYWIFVNILFLFIGSVLDTPAAIVILVPILLPIAKALGIDGIHFGTVIVVNFVIGYITAPFGYNLFVAKGITDLSMEEVSISVVPFLIACLLGLVMITFIPQIVLFFPKLLMG
jgi:C4-dicarboxylate transporter, DctM subunit